MEYPWLLCMALPSGVLTMVKKVQVLIIQYKHALTSLLRCVNVPGHPTCFDRCLWQGQTLEIMADVQAWKCHEHTRFQELIDVHKCVIPKMKRLRKGTSFLNFINQNHLGTTCYHSKVSSLNGSKGKTITKRITP